MTHEDRIQALRLLAFRRAEELRNASVAFCEFGTRHTRTKPHHAWTNGFVERGQDGVLHERWRVGVPASLIQAVAPAAALPLWLPAVLQPAAPRHGYRTRGRAPAALILWAKEE